MPTLVQLFLLLILIGSSAHLIRPLSLQMGYGARALQALGQFYQGELSNLDDLPEAESTDQFDRGHKPNKVRSFS
jgi:hypothetical protein